MGRRDNAGRIYCRKGQDEMLLANHRDQTEESAAAGQVLIWMQEVTQPGLFSADDDKTKMVLKPLNLTDLKLVGFFD